jgi:hypothetical protein
MAGIFDRVVGKGGKKDNKNEREASKIELPKKDSEATKTYEEYQKYLEEFDIKKPDNKNEAYLNYLEAEFSGEKMKSSKDVVMAMKSFIEEVAKNEGLDPVQLWSSLEFVSEENENDGMGEETLIDGKLAINGSKIADYTLGVDERDSLLRLNYNEAEIAKLIKELPSLVTERKIDEIKYRIADFHGRIEENNPKTMKEMKLADEQKTGEKIEEVMNKLGKI